MPKRETCQGRRFLKLLCQVRKGQGEEPGDEKQNWNTKRKKTYPIFERIPTKQKEKGGDTTGLILRVTRGEKWGEGK